MAVAFPREFDRWFAAPERHQARAAADFVRRDLPWSAWSEQFHRVHGRDLEREARAAQVLRRAYARKDRGVAARFRFFEARAVQRAGSPRIAARLFEQCARELEAAGDAPKAAQARVLRVDALAFSGRVDDALELGRALHSDLRGAWAPPWRAALRANLANAHRLRGDLDAALREYEASAVALDGFGQGASAATARMNAGVALLDGGDAEDALRRFETAATAFDAAGLGDMALDARYNRACALAKAARLGEAIEELQRLSASHGGRGFHPREALCRLDLATALLRAGDRAAALAEADRSAESFRLGHAAAERCEALLVAAECAPTPREAAMRLRRARTAARATGRTAIALRCEVKSLDLALRTRGVAAVGPWRSIVRKATALGQEEIAAEARLVVGESALRAGRVSFARERFEEAARAGRARPWIRAAARTGIASCLAREGHTSRALALLRDVTDFLDAVRSQLPGPWLRSVFIFQRLDPWLSRVELLLARGRPADRAEAETVLDGLAMRRFLERRPPRAARGELERLRRRLEALYDRIGRGEGPTRGTEGGDEVAAAEAVARRLEDRVAEVWRRSERADRPGERDPHATEDGSTSLPDTVAAMHVWIRDGRLLALVRKGSTVHDVHDLGSVAELQDDVGRLAFHTDRVRTFGADVEAGPLTASLERIAARLLRPLERARDAEALRLVLDPEAPDLPWEMLPFDGKPLCARFSSLRVPCLRVRRSKTALGSETTYIALGDPNLPGVAMEMRLLAGRAKLLCGAHATRAAFVEALRRPGTVHVAGHGFVPTNVPALGGVRLADGWFGTTDVPPDVAADLVVLAACRTGSERGAAARAWGGLPGTLLAAGARRVLWTTDDVDDSVGSELTLRLHGALSGSCPEDAYGRAIADLWADASMRVYLYPFRMSGVMP